MEKGPYQRKPKQCSRCTVQFTPLGNNQKMCVVCIPIVKKEKSQAHHQEHYIKKGYNQFRENNNNWKTGIGTYKQLKAHILACERCGATYELLVHHKDQNRGNNKIENLEKICKRCHQLEHNCADVLPKGKELSILKTEQASRAKRDKRGVFIK